MNEIRVLLLNGSPRANGNTALALHEMEKVFAQNGVQTETVLLGNQAIRGCTACGASVVCARRGGCSATFDELTKYFTISGMPIASSQYWNSVHGRAAGEAAMDAEGLQTMRTLARNMTFLMKSIALGRETFGLPEQEERVATHFIR